jgi:hypothetical protein
MNKEPIQVKKSKDEILMQVCNITDKEEWSYVEHITPIQALKAMEEYRSRASELPSDEKTLNKISNIIIRYKDEHIYIEEAEKQIIEEVISPILASHVARIKELEEDLRRSNIREKSFSDFRREVLEIDNSRISIIDDKYFPF